MMKPILKRLFFVILIPIVMLLGYLYSVFPHIGEKYYSQGINKWTIQLLSRLTGVIPLSVFEIGVVIGSIVLIFFIIKWFFSLFTSSRGLFKTLLYGLSTSLAILSILYGSFQLLWGLNYKRPHFSVANKLTEMPYTAKDLGELYAFLLEKAESIRSQLPEDASGIVIITNDYEDVFTRAYLGFENASIQFPELKGRYGNAKPFISSKLLNHTGITGMYSPFTGEPNVNIAILPMNVPATTCHEMAHQRGFAFEDECNFIAFLTCSMHPDLDFQYSGYLLAIAYTSNQLAQVDPETLYTLNQNMSSGIYRDLNFHNAFQNQYKGETREIAYQINNSYLESNGIESGMANYNQMVKLLLSFTDPFIQTVPNTSTDKND